MIFQQRLHRYLKYIIIANALMFVFRLAEPEFTRTFFAITPAYVFMMPWTIFTNMFIHADFSHIFMNMIFGVWMFGSYLEGVVGAKNYLKVYFIGGVFAALFYAFISLAFNIPNPLTPAVGASGAVFATIGALVVLRPNMTIYFNFLFPMRLWTFALLYLGYSIVALPTGLGGNVAITAHLGGLIAGYALARQGMLKQEPPTQPSYIRYY